MLRLLTCLTVLFLSSDGFSVGPPAPMSQAEFDSLMTEVSNWGRWGNDDQLGTLNTITAQKRIDAAGLVIEGESVSLALPLNTVSDQVNQKPFVHESFIFGGAELEEMGLNPEEAAQAAGDVYKIDYHGFGHSHLDGINHFAYKGKMYNGYPFDNQDGKGFTNLGIDKIGKSGVFTRGVLVDMPVFFGVKYMEPGDAITIEDLEAWEKASGITISAGDVLLVRTGRWHRVRDKGQWNFVQKAAGMHASVAKWLKERDVAAIGCDGVSDVMPSGVGARLNPLHELVIVGMGMPIFDNLDLDRLSMTARIKDRSTFLFVAAPLKVVGGTGSPLNPIAIF